MRLTLTDPRAKYMKPVTPVLKFVINFRKIVVVILLGPTGIVILSRDKITTVVIPSRRDILTTVVICHGSYSVTLHRHRESLANAKVSARQ